MDRAELFAAFQVAENAMNEHFASTRGEFIGGAGTPERREWNAEVSKRLTDARNLALGRWAWARALDLADEIPADLLALLPSPDADALHVAPKEVRYAFQRWSRATLPTSGSHRQGRDILGIRYYLE